MLVSTEVRHIGGALARSAPHHGARDKLDGGYLMFALGAVMEPGDVEVIEADADRVVRALAPYASGSEYLNFVETGSYDVSKAFSAENWERLRRVKAEFDPDGVFLANHEIR